MNILKKYSLRRALVFATTTALTVCAPSESCRAQSVSYLCTKGDSIVIRSRCRSGETRIKSLAALSKKVASTTLASGKTVSGIFGITLQSAATDDVAYASASFPFKAPMDVSDADIIVKTDSNSDDECEGQLCAEAAFDSKSALCLGSSAAPTAPKGKVCIYIDYVQNVRARSVGGVLVGGRDADTGDHLSRQGFQVYGLTGPLGVGYSINGTWAYTAP